MSTYTDIICRELHNAGWSYSDTVFPQCVKPFLRDGEGCSCPVPGHVSGRIPGPFVLQIAPPSRSRHRRTRQEQSGPEEQREASR